MEVPASHLRFPLFDSLRALAAISVFVFHVALATVFLGGPVYSVPGALLAHLNIGVPFFFLLSAFLLYRPFVAARIEGRERPGLGDWAQRRFLRIVPAYWAVLTITAVIPGMYGAFSGNWWVYYGLFQNFPIYSPAGECAGYTYRCAVPPAWSLAVEIFFYAMLPLIALGLAWVGKRIRTRSWLVPELAMIAVLGLASIPLQTTSPMGGILQVIHFSPIGFGLWFALGLGLASVSVWVQHERWEPSWVWAIKINPWIPVGLGVGLYLFMSLFVLVPYPLATFPLRDLGLYPFEFVAFGIIALLVMLPATFGDDGLDRFRSFLRHGVMTWLGLISYGIFLWHFPVIILMHDLGVDGWWPAMDFPVLLITSFAVTVACAAASYYALERPIMRWGREHSPWRARRRADAPALRAVTGPVPDARAD